MSDDRIEVVLRSEGGAEARVVGPDEWLVADPAAFEAHIGACACCGGRSPFATTLTGLFTRRARGETRFFRRIVAVSDEGGLRAARDALESDLCLRSRYRVAEN
jgi:hypothetical protein